MSVLIFNLKPTSATETGIIDPFIAQIFMSRGSRVGDCIFETHEVHSAVVDLNRILGVQMEIKARHRIVLCASKTPDGRRRRRRVPKPHVIF